MKELLERIKLFLFKAKSSSALIEEALNQKEKSDKLRDELLLVSKKLEQIKEEAKELELTLKEEKEAHLSEAILAHEEMVARLEKQHQEQIRIISEEANAEIAALEEIFNL